MQVTQLPRLIMHIATNMDAKTRAPVVAAFRDAVDVTRDSIARFKPQDHVKALEFFAYCIESLEAITGMTVTDPGVTDGHRLGAPTVTAASSDAAAVAAGPGAASTTPGPSSRALCAAAGGGSGGSGSGSGSGSCGSPGYSPRLRRASGSPSLALPVRMRSLARAAVGLDRGVPVTDAEVVVEEDAAMPGPDSESASGAAAAGSGGSPTGPASWRQQLSALLAEDNALLLGAHEACCELVVRHNCAVAHSSALQRPSWLPLRPSLSSGTAEAPTAWHVAYSIDLKQGLGYSCRSKGRADGVAGSVEWVIARGETLMIITSMGELYVFLANRPRESYVLCDRAQTLVRTAHVTAGPTASAGLFFVLAPSRGGDLLVMVVGMGAVESGFAECVRSTKRIVTQLEIDQ